MLLDDCNNNELLRSKSFCYGVNLLYYNFEQPFRERFRYTERIQKLPVLYVSSFFFSS